MPLSDQLQRFLFEQGNIRGELVRLEHSLQDVLARRALAQPAAQLLAESLAAVVLMSSVLKYEGLLALQARGKGPISLLVAECTHDKKVRGIVQCDDLLPVGSMRDLIGQGQLVMTLEPHHGNRYQGMVPLEHDSLAECVEDYFQRSQQLDTCMILFADGVQSAGLMLQKMPSANPESDEDLWQRAVILARTIKAEELFTLDAENILHRLFHEEDVRLFPAESIVFSCSCSHERTSAALRALGRQECYDLLEEQGAIGLDCQFCGHHYRFLRQDVDAIFGAHLLH